MNADKFDILRAASELSHPGYGAWLFDTWAALNNQYFDGELTVIPIIWGLTPHGGLLGAFDGHMPRITLHTSLLKPAGDAWGISRILGPVFATDVLLHEMIHQSIHQQLGHGGCGHDVKKGSRCTSHNNEHWVSEVNRLARAIGLPVNAAVITQKRVKSDSQKGKGKVVWFVEDGNMSRDDLSRWPHSVRPKDYYEVETAPLVSLPIG